MTSPLPRVNADGDTVQDVRAVTVAPSHPTPAEATRQAMAVLQRLGDGAQTPALHLHETIGEGGMGVVRLGTQVALGRRVAVKTVKPDHRSSATTLKLLHEAWLTGALEHPNVVPVYDLQMDAHGSPVMVLKRIEGVHWGALMADADGLKARFAVTDPLEWHIRTLMSVCNAVHFAHSRGIIHRDLKPENVMVGAFGEVYVLDWGIAVSLMDDASGRLPLAAHATEMAGTPCYMAPEMLGEDPPRISPRTDVYLLGAMLYEIVMHRPPHDGGTLMEMVQRVVMSEPVFDPAVPEDLVRLCRRAMERDPDGRFETAEQFRLALQGFLQHQGSRQLAEAARVSLGALVAATQSADAMETLGRIRTHDRFSECRFGFQQALRAWSENEVAREGLTHALETMIDYELAAGDPTAAAVLLAGMRDPDAARARRVADAQRIATERDARVQALVNDQDERLGARTRGSLAVIFGALWTVAPLAMGSTGGASTRYGLATAGAATLLAAAAMVGWWARDSMTRSALNRALGVAGLGAITADLLLMVGGQLAHAPLGTMRAVEPLVWALATAQVALSAEPRLLIATGAYVLAFLVAMWRPQLWAAAASASSFVLLILTWRLWRAPLVARMAERISRVIGRGKEAGPAQRPPVS